MPVQLEQYRIFAAVAQNKSFRKAAEQLFVTQPAVSQSIKQLETQLGAQLFVRTPKGADLTESGEILYRYVESALSLLSGAENRLAEMRSLEHGTLNVGASDTLCQHFLLPYLQRYHERYPRVNIRVTNRTSKETVELLRYGKVDLGFINAPTEKSDQFAVTPLMALHDCFVYSPEKFSLFDRPMRLRDLESAPLLMLETESSSRRYLDAFCRSQRVPLQPQIELGSHDLLLAFAEKGLGVAAVTREYSLDYLQSGKLKEIRLSEAIPARSVSLIHLEKIPLSFAAKEFISLFTLPEAPSFER